MHMNQIISGLRNLIGEVENCPALTVYHKEVLFKEVAAPDPGADPVTEFYSGIGRFIFSYGWKASFPLSKRKHLREKYPLHDLPIYSDENNPLGALHFLSQDIVFNEEDFFHFTSSDNQEILFGKKIWQLYQLSHLIRPFDLMSDFAAGAFLMQQPKKPLVLLLQGHYDDWNNSVISDFKSYMRLVLATKGLVNSRIQAYTESGGHNRPPVSYQDLITKVGEFDFNEI